MFMNKKKNNTTTRLPMTGKVKKGFRFYCSLVAVLTIIAGTCVPAFAATSDPITVVNNLSDFIFGLIRAIGLILLGSLLQIVYVYGDGSDTAIDLCGRTDAECWQKLSEKLLRRAA